MYEVTMFCTKHSDHNIVTASLEVLQQMLQTRPKSLIGILLSPNGILPTVTNASLGIGGLYFDFFLRYRSCIILAEDLAQ